MLIPHVNIIFLPLTNSYVIGTLLKCISSELVGVDIAEYMIEKARNKHCYDTLVVADASTFLQSLENSSVDLIVASDVFIYIGALDEIFKACQYALKTAASLIFTIEELELLLPESRDGGDRTKYVADVEHINDSRPENIASGPRHINDANDASQQNISPVDHAVGYWLMPCGRFGHSVEYIDKLAEAYSFKVVLKERGILRTQVSSVLT